MPNNEVSISTEHLNPLYRSVFDNKENGVPNDISKKGCLALARLGVASWNAWRTDFPVLGGKSHHGYGETSEYINSVDFSNHTFNELINFSNFNFGNNSNFENAEFKKQAVFDYANFDENTNFDLVKFHNGARFQNTKFEDGVRFRCAEFSKLAFFCHALFGGKADFSGAKFNGQTSFDKVVFGNELIFNQANFDCVVTSFMGASWEDFCLTYPLEEIDSIKLWAAKRNLQPGRISCASFCGVKFNGTVDFSGNEFVGKTRFSLSYILDSNKKFAPFKFESGIPIVFGLPPIFHNCKFNQDVSFDRAEFPNSNGHESSIRAYRTLKLAFAQMQAVREEHFFFKLEMAEEHKAIKGASKWLHSAYAILSDYGFSALRPLIFLLTTLLFAWIAYGLISGFSFCIPFLSNCTFNRDWFEFGLINAFPLPGFDNYAELVRIRLFPAPQYSPTSQILVTAVIILQKSCSLLALFLIGLALRNAFKMK